MSGKWAAALVLFAAAAVGATQWWGGAIERPGAPPKAPATARAPDRVLPTPARAPVLSGPVERVLYRVSGMSCGGCQAEIAAALQANPGVGRVGVDVARGTVSVEYDPARADPKALARVITAQGYPARYLASGAGVPLPSATGPAASGGCCNGKDDTRRGCDSASPARPPT